MIPFAELIRMHAARRPRHAALVQDGEVLDYAGLDEAMDRVAAALQRDGLRAGDSVAIAAPISISYATLFLGALRAGVVVAPLAPSSTPEALAAMVADSGAKLFFSDFERFETWLAARGARPAPAEVRPESPFNIIYSSGTTGAPKGIVQSHLMRGQH